MHLAHTGVQAIVARNLIFSRKFVAATPINTQTDGKKCIKKDLPVHLKLVQLLPHQVWLGFSALACLRGWGCGCRG